MTTVSNSSGSFAAQAGTARPLTASGFLARLAGWLLAALLLIAAAWTAWVVHEINLIADTDDARPSEAIAVFGAAEYNGRPSPIYHVRLDHAVALYRRQIAPVIITLGGSADPTSGKSEGGVGRDYLLANGVPYANIIAETHSTDTEQQVMLLAEIARQNHFATVVVVSDPTHLFRIRELCTRQGLTAYTSPRPSLGHISALDLGLRYLHEVVGYTALRSGLSNTSFYRTVAGKPEE